LKRDAYAQAALLAGALALSSGATAQTQDPWSASATLASDYRSKGVSKTGGRPGAAFELERALRSETYLGLSANSVRNSASSDAQINLGLGWRPEAFGLDWEFGSAHEFYPGSRTDGNDVVWQLSARVRREMGAVTLGVRVQHQPDGFGGTGANTYAALDGSWRLHARVEAVAGLGGREQENSVEYTAWNAGLILEMHERIALDVRWFATDQDAEGANHRDRLVTAVTLDF
jgi:uncharacterized protein (TIGR02001 family)